MKQQAVPIIMGFILTALLSVVGFVWGEIQTLKQDTINHRVQLAQLITPNGEIIPAPGNAEARQVVADRLNSLELEVKLAGQEERSALMNKITTLTVESNALREFTQRPSRSKGEVEKLDMKMDFIYNELTNKINHLRELR